MKKIFTILIVLFMLPIIAKANIICNDGTESPSCTTCEANCCSHHSGCSNNNENYDDDNETIGNFEAKKFDSTSKKKKNDKKIIFILSGTITVLMLSFAGYKIVKNLKQYKRNKQ